MSPASNDVQAYLDATYDSWFWRWSDDGRVVTWQDGTTIAFRDELFYVLRNLAPQGLPSLDALVLLLAACRSSWFTCRSQLDRHEQLPLESLDRVAQLPPALRESLRCKVILAGQAFESSPGRLHDKMTLKVIEQLEQFQPAPIRSTPLHGSRNHLLESIRIIEEGLRYVDEESLKLRAQTGLDQLPDAATLDEVSDVERMKQLLSTLSAEGDVSGMARLVKRLMAAMTVPRPLLHRDDIQLGGVNDLTNRGQLDRLLLSELAHDDLVFSARMALNELLFLQRESPPKDAPEFRAILLDSGLRMWGTPRVFATAVAMALLATGTKKTVTGVYRAAGEQLVSADLTSVDGLTSHLAALEVDVHPGRVLTSFEQAVAEKGDARPLPILVTCPEVMDDAEFLAALQSTKLRPLLIATVERSGHFQMISYGEHEQRLLSQADLALEDLFPDRIGVKKGTSARSVRNDEELPLEILQEPHTLCPPYDLNMAVSATVTVDRRSTVVVTHDRRLLCFDSSDRHGVQVVTSLPHGGVFWISDPTSGQHLTAFVENQLENRTYLLRVDTMEHTYSIEPLQIVCDTPMVATATYQGYFFLIRRTSVDLLDSQGRFITRSLIPQGFVYSGLHRYFHCGPSAWMCMAVKDRSIVFEPISIPQSATPNTYVRKLIHFPQVDGPLGVLPDGKLLDMSTNQITHCFEHSFPIKDVRMQSCDLRRCVIEPVTAPNRASRFVVTSILKAGNIGTNPYVTVDDRELRIPLKLEEFRPKSSKDHTRFRFSHVSSLAHHRSHALMLWQGRTGRVLRLAPSGNGSFILTLDSVRSPTSQAANATLDDDEVSATLGHRYEFEPLHIRKMGIRLFRANLPTGKRLILDTRGMLHFIPGHSGALRLSMVLCNQGEVAGHLSDGRWCGPVRFHRNPNPALWVSSHYIFSDYILPFVEA